MFQRQIYSGCSIIRINHFKNVLGRNYGVLTSKRDVNFTPDNHLLRKKLASEYSLYSFSVLEKRSLSTESFLTFPSKVFTYISESPATESFKTYVISVHEMTGLPWWATVVCCTFLLRTCITLPLAIYQSRIIAKIENISLLEMPEIAQEVRKDTSKKVRELRWTENKAKFYYKHTMKKRWNDLIIRDNCHPFKATITLWVQLPTWVFFSAALRNMAYMLPYKNAEAQMLYMSIAFGGIAWIPNLTQPDGLLILPIVLGLSNLAIIEIQSMMRMREPTRLQRYVTNFFRCFSIILIPIAATVPSIVCLYWTSSSVIGLCHNLLLMSNKVKRFCRIPDTPSTLDHPYQQLMHEIRGKASVLNVLRKKS